MSDVMFALKEYSNKRYKIHVTRYKIHVTNDYRITMLRLEYNVEDIKLQESIYK